MHAAERIIEAGISRPLTSLCSDL